MDFSGLGARQSEPPPKSPQPQVPSRLPDHVLNALQSESVSFSSKSHATVGRAGSMGIPPVTVGNVSPTTEHGHSSRRLPVHATQSMAIRTQPNIPRDFSIHVDHIRERSGSSAGVVMPASRTRTESPELSAAEALDAILKPSGSGGLPDNIPRLMHTGESVTTHAEATTNPSTPTPVTIPPRTGQAPIPSCTRTHSDETGPLVTPRRPIDTRRASTPGVLEIRSVMPSSPAELRSADDVVSSLPDRGRVGSHDSLAQNFDNGDPPQALPRSRSCSAGPGNGRLSSFTTKPCECKYRQREPTEKLTPDDITQPNADCKHFAQRQCCDGLLVSN
ncbi:hypothetical protein SARC_00395 [Sphaeroforma arctica JP610]|uniref:Uncharacterized protein n=1 Tax=Sphaeroforma arctica JP610 TaxID=667725 RepID=A0A0L0GER3_9EUKA|nr:hypothetical protein SARC_00395 [Sphaeroforma arctica JP610]KNC87510.1 hypothetical protein SARC_00395 [Sphaeroforma arctica JP610]|eukprot:XP_014161412.1 hypothetical protein SARC_00395 [Sphaeroforma arctica JP610]